MRAGVAGVALCFGAAVEKNSPVSQVVGLLKGMSTQLEDEASHDEHTYKKLACWCDTNDKGKTQAIADAENKIDSLTSDIEEATARSAQLDADIKELKKEVTENTEDLKEATALRKQAQTKAEEEEKETVKAIQGLKAAIVVLSKHQTPASLESVKEIITHVMRKHEDALIEVLAPKHAVVASFLQAPPGPAAYASGSGEVFGVLQNMKSTLENDLEDLRRKEKEEKVNFAELKAVKQREIDGLQGQVNAKSDELASTNQKLENDKTDKEDTEAAKDADTSFLADLKTRCRNIDNEYSQRQMSRNEEIGAVQEAIKILSDDDAFETFGKSFGFVQLDARRAGQAVRARVQRLLVQVATRTHSGQLAALAGTMGLDSFEKINEAIDKMVARLKTEMEDEVKHRDYCTAELASNEKTTGQKNKALADDQAEVQSLAGDLKKINKAIEDAQAEIADIKKAILEAGQNREGENAEYQETINNQRKTQELLQKALSALNKVYGKKTTLLQHKHTQPQPAGFEKKKKNAGGTGVVSLIEQLIGDSKEVEQEAKDSERQAQSDYESFVSDSNDSIDKLKKQITDREEEKSEADEEMTLTNQDIKATQGDLDHLASVRSDLHKECDFTLKNFDARQKARKGELEGLASAKSILAGADLS